MDLQFDLGPSIVWLIGWVIQVGIALKAWSLTGTIVGYAAPDLVPMAAPDLTNEQNIVHHSWMKRIANVTQQQHHGSPAEPQPIGTSLHGVPVLLMGAEFKHPK